MYMCVFDINCNFSSSSLKNIERKKNKNYNLCICV